MSGNYYDVQFNCSRNRIPDRVSSAYTVSSPISQGIFPQNEQKVKISQVSDDIQIAKPENDVMADKAANSEDVKSEDTALQTDVYSEEKLPEENVDLKAEKEPKASFDKENGIMTVTVDGKEYKLPYEECQMEDGITVLTGFDKEQGICYSETIDKDGNMLCKSLMVRSERTYWDYRSGIVEETKCEPGNPFTQITQRYDIESGNYIDAERNEIISFNKTQRGYVDSNGQFQASEEPANYWAPPALETSVNIANMLTDIEQEQAAGIKDITKTINSVNNENTTFGKLTIKEHEETSSVDYVDYSQPETDVQNVQDIQDVQESSVPESASTIVLDGDNLYKELVASFQLQKNGGYDEDDARIFAGKYLQYLEKGFSEEQASSMSKEYARVYSLAIDDERFSAKQISDYMKLYNFYIMSGIPSEEAQDMAAEEIGQ